MSLDDKNILSVIILTATNGAMAGSILFSSYPSQTQVLVCMIAMLINIAVVAAT